MKHHVGDMFIAGGILALAVFVFENVAFAASIGGAIFVARAAMEYSRDGVVNVLRLILPMAVISIMVAAAYYL